MRLWHMFRKMVDWMNLNVITVVTRAFPKACQACPAVSSGHTHTHPGCSDRNIWKQNYSILNVLPPFPSLFSRMQHCEGFSLEWDLAGVSVFLGVRVEVCLDSESSGCRHFSITQKWISGLLWQSQSSTTVTSCTPVTKPDFLSLPVDSPRWI